MHLLFLKLLSVSLFAGDADIAFRDVVLPALQKECLGCHGATQQLGKLDLRSRAAILKGGGRGAAMIPGDSQGSLLYRALINDKGLQMPPGVRRLPAATIAAFKVWIDAGAKWSEEGASSSKWSYKAEDLWAFERVKKAAIPKIGSGSPIDAFIEQKLATAGLKPAPAADRRTLIRRVTIDLTGLPPSPAEVETFVNDKSPDAWSKLVERLLASPRYGERWGRHWLDVVRYADTSGYSNDFERPNAWRYRDYVIRSFNQDKPYNQFIREQIAGDEIDAKNGEAIIATGFLRAGPWEHTAMSVEAVTRQMFLDDVTHSVAATLLGLTLGCARCHDHKFDPIPTRDYYRMQAIFATTEFARPAVPFLQSENTAEITPGKDLMRQIADANQAKMAGFDEMVKQRLMQKLGTQKLEEIPKPRMQAALREREGLQAEEFESFKLYQKHQQLYRESLDRFEPKAFSVSSGPLDGFTDGGLNLKYPPSAKYAAAEVHVLPGGNLQSPADKVEPGVLSAVERLSGFAGVEIPTSISGRRTALANWIVDEKNPLTARVMVNRIWQYHFGKGIAQDANNFGKMGHKPTHPELLDWLAGMFVEQGWSVKQMHRLILNSAAYQRSSNHPDAANVNVKDPGNQLLSFYTPRRVEAEVFRDSILAVAGELSLDAGGPGSFPQINEDVVRQPRHVMGSLQPAYQASPQKRLRNRRTVYSFQQRSLIDPMIDVFNGPSLDFSCERRESATVPTQAFTLFNGQFVHDMALAMAARLEKESSDAKEQINRAFFLAFGRQAEEAEIRFALRHIESQTAYHKQHPPAAREPRQPIVHTITSELTGEKSKFIQQQWAGKYEENLHPSEVGAHTRALADFALVLLNSNEFAYVY